jgi:hypothetical protein
MVSLEVRLLIAAILLILVLSFLYKFIRSFLVDRSFAEDLLFRWRRHTPRGKAPLFLVEPSAGMDLTVILYAPSSLEATRERIRAICEYLATNLPDKNFELIAVTSSDDTEIIPNSLSIHAQFPSAFVLGTMEKLRSIRSFTHVALKARGTFMIDADYLESELAKLPSENDPTYLSFIDPLPEGPYFRKTGILVLVAAAKKASIALFRNLHVGEFGLAEEIRLIAQEKKLSVNVEKKGIPSADHAATYWIVNRLASLAVRFMYDRKLWVMR